MPASDYPHGWPVVSRMIRDRARGRCECTGQCGLHRGDRCIERDGKKALFASGDVVLTVAHLNHCAEDCRPENLLALCNTCHLRYDQVLHATHAWATRRSRMAIGDLFDTTVEHLEATRSEARKLGLKIQD